MLFTFLFGNLFGSPGRTAAFTTSNSAPFTNRIRSNPIYKYINIAVLIESTRGLIISANNKGYRINNSRTGIRIIINNSRIGIRILRTFKFNSYRIFTLTAIILIKSLEIFYTLLFNYIIL